MEVWTVNASRLVFERCSCRRESPEEISAFPYSLLGNLCAAVGATLAGLLHIQVTPLTSTTELRSCRVHICPPPPPLQVLLSALAAALDALHFLWWCLHLFLCWNSKSGNNSIIIVPKKRRCLVQKKHIFKNFMFNTIMVLKYLFIDERKQHF